MRMLFLGMAIGAIVVILYVVSNIIIRNFVSLREREEQLEKKEKVYGKFDE